MEYNWEDENNANLIKRYHELTRDSEKFNRAKGVLKNEIESMNSALNSSLKAGRSKRQNPATLHKLSRGDY